MDNLTYKYYPNTNRLRQVNDAISDGSFPVGGSVIYDLDNQTDTSNYVYDAIGNLIQDKKEQITDIQWNVYGKITEITRTSSGSVPVTNIKYFYDALGNRIGKVFDLSGNKRYTWYVRDAQGNLLSIYDANPNGNPSLDTLNIHQVEQYLYGSSRLGMYAVSQPVDNSNAGPGSTQFYTGRQLFRGQRNYELTNHLGNVLATVTDKKIGVSSGGSLNDYYNPDIVSATDYYPFGMAARMMVNLSNYTRFGFNGKEFDWEVKGWQNEYDYGMRVYDPRIGKFLSVDPIAADYPWYTPYQFAGNKPVWAIDRDGAEEWYYWKRDVFDPGWTKSKFLSGPLSEEYANKLGYYSARQVHHQILLANGEAEFRERERKVKEWNAAVEGVNRSRNLFTLAFDLSPINAAIDAYQAVDEGNYAMAAIIGVTGAGDFSALFKAVGKQYAGLAKGFAAAYSVEKIWTFHPTVRGMLLEAKLASDYVKNGFEWLAEISPFFRKFDFYDKENFVALSLKTVKADKNFDFKNILKNIDQLAELKAAGKNAQYGREFLIKRVKLDIVIPKDYDENLLNEVIRTARTKLGHENVNIIRQ